jgi:hypothetical protein
MTPPLPLSFCAVNEKVGSAAILLGRVRSACDKMDGVCGKCLNCTIVMDCPASLGPFGVLECFSHEILEKVAFFLDLDNLKKLSKASTVFRQLAISVRSRYVQFLQ